MDDPSELSIEEIEWWWWLSSGLDRFLANATFLLSDSIVEEENFDRFPDLKEVAEGLWVNLCSFRRTERFLDSVGDAEAGI